jgi:Zn-finger nucleic acid-binding protein
MEALSAGSVEIDVCISCGTRWFDRTELSAIVAQTMPGAVIGWGERLNEDEVSAICPRCRTDTLVPYKYGPAGFRRCSTCRGVAIPSQDLDLILKSVGGAGGKLAEVVRQLFGA